MKSTGIKIDGLDVLYSKTFVSVADQAIEIDPVNDGVSQYRIKVYFEHDDSGKSHFKFATKDDITKLRLFNTPSGNFSNVERMRIANVGWNRLYLDLFMQTSGDGLSLRRLITFTLLRGEIADDR